MKVTAAAESPTLFRFDANRHEYIELTTGVCFPHITGMLAETGWIDDTWYTEESSVRGTAVHRLTADYDLGALDVADCHSIYRGYLLGHVAAMQILQPTWWHIEEPLVHARHRYGGRPDRVGLVYAARAIVEGKSGDFQKAHLVQTALQAILVEPELGIPAEAIPRYCLYWRDNGKFKIEQHRDRRDFDEARRVIRRCCV